MTEDKFDQFLAKASDEQARQREQQARLETITRLLCEQLDASGIRRIVDMDESEEQRRSEEYAEYISSQIRAELQERSDYALSADEADIERHIVIETNAIVALTGIRQHQLLGIAAQVMAYADSDGVSESDVTDYKKKVMANMMIRTTGGYEYDETELRFFAEATPGDVLDPNDPKDQQYIAEAMTMTAADAEQNERYRRLLDEAYGVVGVAPDSIHVDDTALRKVAAVGDIIRHAIMTDGRPEEGNMRAERHQLVYEKCREAGIGQDAAARLAVFIDENFPLAGSPNESDSKPQPGH